MCVEQWQCVGVVLAVLRGGIYRELQTCVRVDGYYMNSPTCPTDFIGKLQYTLINLRLIVNVLYGGPL